MNIDELRNKIFAEKVSRGIGLRELETLSGVSYSSISRFLRGEILETRNLIRLQAFLSGESPSKRKVISTKRMKVGAKVFLVTIEELI